MPASAKGQNCKSPRLGPRLGPALRPATEPGKRHCTSHSCDTLGCTNGKSSKAERCSGAWRAGAAPAGCGGDATLHGTHCVCAPGAKCTGPVCSETKTKHHRTGSVQGYSLERCPACTCFPPHQSQATPLSMQLTDLFDISIRFDFVPKVTHAESCLSNKCPFDRVGAGCRPLGTGTDPFMFMCNFVQSRPTAQRTV